MKTSYSKPNRRQILSGARIEAREPARRLLHITLGASDSEINQACLLSNSGERYDKIRGHLLFYGAKLILDGAENTMSFLPKQPEAFTIHLHNGLCVTSDRNGNTEVFLGEHRIGMLDKMNKDSLTYLIARIAYNNI